MLTADDVQSHVPGQRYFGVDYEEKTTTDFEGYASVPASVPVTVAANAVLLNCLLRMKSMLPPRYAYCVCRCS